MSVEVKPVVASPRQDVYVLDGHGEVLFYHRSGADAGGGEAGESLEYGDGSSRALVDWS